MRRIRKERNLRDWRNWLIGCYAIIVFMLALLWAFALLSPMEQVEEDQQYRTLETAGQAGAALLESGTMDAAGVAEKLGNDDLRITVIDGAGDVLADSVDDASSMDDHSTRTEVAAALTGAVGKDRRVSATDGIEYLYLAMPASYQGNAAVLRASVPASEVTAFAQTFRMAASATLLVAILLTAFMAVYTLRRSSEPVEYAERVRTDFVANASHELKTPIAGILLLSESMDQACDDVDLKTVSMFNGHIRKEGKRLQSIVTEMMDLSRLENGGFEGIDTEAADLCAIVAASYEGHLVQARSKGLNFTLDDQLGETATARITLPPSDTTLLVDNLIENAITYTEEGSVTVRISSTANNLILEVEDTGIGIAYADQERVFERFYRVDKARSREAGGTGLGLSLVRHATQRAGGRIELRSTPGHGSTFRVIFPRA